MKPGLDFAIIGAQKGGTTSLHQYLSRHPGIAMPREKEAYFFNDDERWNRGWAWYEREVLPRRRAGQLVGTSTPQYLTDPEVPERLRSTLPDVRLIAILRNPIDRAFAHYRMAVRLGLEQRSFFDAVAELSAPDAAERARSLRATEASESSCYLAWGEYGRLLGSYLRYFARGQLLVLFTEELAVDPVAVMDRILGFVGLEPGFRPPNLGRRYNVGGDRARLPWLRPLSRVRAVRVVYQALLPAGLRRTIAFWSRVYNVKPMAEASSPDAAVREAMRAYFASDVALLRRVTDLDPPWTEFPPTPGATP